MRKLLAVLVTIALIGCVVVAANNLEPFKGAPPSSLIRVYKLRPTIMTAHPEKAEDYETYMRTQMQMITSDFHIQQI